MCIRDSYKEGRRQIVLFEGITGTGKTTLCRHVSREWAKKQLLKQFYLLIHVRLNDPRVHSAKTLDDFIINAMENWICKEVTSVEKRICKEVTSYIFDLKGESICFLLDGLDEAPPALLNTVLDLIKGRLGVQLPHLSFIMTTRPNPHIITEMKSILGSKIVIGGFSVAKLHEFVDIYLGSLDDKKGILREKFANYPTLEKFCTLPVNAVNMAYLVQSFSDAASYSKAGIYQFIVSNFLVRHIRLRTDQKSFSRISKLTDSDLPSQIQEPFKQMCLLAYTALVKEKALFTATELGMPLLKVDNILGVLQVHRKVTMMGEKQYYSFPNPSLQEFLAAVHVSSMNEHEQISARKCLSPSVLELIDHLCV